MQPHKLLTALTLALTILPLSASAASAPAPASTEAIAPDRYDDLYDAMRTGIDDTAMIDGQLDTIKTQMMAQDALLAAAEQASPGLMDTIGEAMRPVLSEYSERVRLQFRPRMVAVMRSTFTDKEAGQLSEMYRSTAGKGLMRSMSQNYKGEATIGQAIVEKEVDAKAINRDFSAATSQATKAMPDDQKAEMAQYFLKNPSLFLKLGTLSRDAAAIRVEMENAPMTADEEARMQQAIVTAIEAHVGHSAPASAKAVSK